MTLAAAILAHRDLPRVASVARFLTNSGIHIAIHIDASVDAVEFNDFKTSLADCPDIFWTKRVECQWGDFTLVDATLRMSSGILQTWPDTAHVLLLSGDSIPVRPPSELIAHLAENPKTDYIESVLVNGNNWVADGLGIERFTLHFPFSWKSQRRLFDTWVEVQRKLRIKRRIPENLRLHIGSQWWCLSRDTLQAILNDPNRKENDAYFKKCWIPDESYFATLARKYSSDIDSQSLVFSKFDYQGKPIIFYDDHADALSQLDTFFARKVWPGADALYSRFVTDAVVTSAAPIEKHTETTIGEHAERRQFGRAGLHIQRHVPSGLHGLQMATAAPYTVYCGVRAVFPTFDIWIKDRAGTHPMGRIFAKDCVHFDENGGAGPGGLSTVASIRDLAPEAFLCNLVWNTQNEGLGFHYDADDTQDIAGFLLRDQHATINYIAHSWVIDLMQQNITNADFLQAEAAKFAKQERAFVARVRALNTVAKVNIWTVGDALSNPAAVLSPILADAGGAQEGAPVVLPKISTVEGLIGFGQKLQNMGVAMNLSALEATPVGGNGSLRVQVRQ